MKRVCQIFCISLFVLAMATTAMATGTRVGTMGSQGMFITDDYNIWHWTSTVNNYPRHMIVDYESAMFQNDFAGSGDTRIGMIMPFMKDGVLGVFVGDESASIPSTFNGRNANSRIDLFWGKRLSSMDVGVHLEWWGDSDKETGTNSTSIIGLALGVAKNQGGNMMEFNGFFRMIDYTNETPTVGPVIDVNSTKDAGSNFGLAWRWMRSYNSSTTIIPAISFETWKISELVEGAPINQDGDEYKYTMFDVGVGCNVVPLSGTEFLGSIGFMMDKEERSDSAGQYYEVKNLTTPYLKFGADIQVKPWWNVRVGAVKYVFSKNTQVDFTTTPDPDREQTNASFDFQLGTGIMLGDIQFDFQIDPEFLFNGPYFISGTYTDPLAWYASFKYDYR